MKELFLDLKECFNRSYLWLKYGWFDVKMRYKRSFLGPFWLTISIGIMIGVMGIIYSSLFSQPISTYLPFVGTSLVLWFFLMMNINDGTLIFINSHALILDVYLPLSTHIMRFIWRNIIIFLHNFGMVIILMTVFKIYSLSFLLFPLMFLMVCIFFIFFLIILAMVCARYRDTPPIVLAVTQVLMFVTPVFWKKDFLNKYEWITLVNPVYHLLEIMRAPILNNPFPWRSFYITLGMIFVLILICAFFIKKYKYRVPYWVQ